MLHADDIHLYPAFPVIAQELGSRYSGVQSSNAAGLVRYRGVRRFRGQPLRRDMLYVISAEDQDAFPVDDCGWVSPDRICGEAEHLYCPGVPVPELLEALQDLFLQLQEIENRILGLLYRGGTLSDLCELAEELLGNPVCIHDSWFMILARSRSTGVFMPHTQQSWETFPQSFLDEFRMDAEYRRTYQKQGIQLWDSQVNGRALHTLYVNLHENGIFRGRILVTDALRSFQLRDRMITELLAEQTLQLMVRKRELSGLGHRSTDDILLDILKGTFVSAPEFSALMRLLQWEKDHRLLCIRIQRQEAAEQDPVDHLLHRELFLAFPGSYILYTGTQQCIVLNLTRTPVSMSQVSHLLSPLCRDYYQYAGISSPVEGIRELPVAFAQAHEALARAFRLRDDRWIVRFQDCALEYVLTHLNTPMQLRHLAAPQLLKLLELDREKGSQLFLTLKTYLDNERDIPRTAARLIIHRTTLTYRLKKIASVVDLDLEDPQARLYLQLSLRMLEQEKIVKLSEQRI